ncbi:tetratricopeptide repeat protein [Acidobacterium sp. S8]|uniref:tetratricopeptide repeat protein n=1 Tax=Acidobacterium sp. S8 TaxID=1641854 RepID=UPI00131DC6C1|nr:tetratricopeptide repeat protein [Acidobacterium sp. S8]
MVGDLYRHQCQPDNAMSEYAKALAIDSHDPAAQLGMAAIQLSEGHPEQAVLLAQAALADRPQDLQLNLMMSEALVASHQYTEAKSYLEKCLDAPADLLPQVHGLLGRVDAAEGKTSSAIQQLELALPSDKDGSLHYQLSRLYRKSGDTARAQKATVEAQALANARLVSATIAIRETTALNPQRTNQ